MEAGSDASVTTPMLRLRRGIGGQSGENTSPQTQSAQAASVAADSSSPSYPRVGRARQDDMDVTVAAAAAPGRRVAGLRPRITNQDTPSAAAPPAAEAADSREAEPMQPAADILCEPAAACTAAEVKARLVKMFLTAEEGPVASHRDRVAPETSPAMENTGVHPHLGQLWQLRHAGHMCRCDSVARGRAPAR